MTIQTLIALPFVDLNRIEAALADSAARPEASGDAVLGAATRLLVSGDSGSQSAAEARHERLDDVARNKAQQAEQIAGRPDGSPAHGEPDLASLVGGTWWLGALRDVQVFAGKAAEDLMRDGAAGIDQSIHLVAASLECARAGLEHLGREAAHASAAALGWLDHTSPPLQHAALRALEKGETLVEEGERAVGATLRGWQAAADHAGAELNRTAAKAAAFTEARVHDAVEWTADKVPPHQVLARLEVALERAEGDVRQAAAWLDEKLPLREASRWMQDRTTRVGTELRDAVAWAGEKLPGHQVTTCLQHAAARVATELEAAAAWFGRELPSREQLADLGKDAERFTAPLRSALARAEHELNLFADVLRHARDLERRAA